jgi:TRAP-type C4-dicarboxylate transport system permease small subunit
VLIAVTSVLLLLMMAVVTANVTGRYFLRSPVPSTVDTVGLVGALLISLALAPSETRKRTLNIPIIIDTLPQRARVIFDVAGLVFSMAILTVLTWTGGAHAWDMLVKHERTAILEWPVAPFRFVWAFGCLLFLIVLAARLVREVGKAVNLWSR